MSTDASYRFERGVDPAGVLAALDRAAALIQELAGGRIRRDLLDVYPKPILPLEIALHPHKLAQFSALPELEPAELRRRFLALGIETAGRGAHDALKFRIPTFRPDITEEVDLIEEAMRLIGFDQIPDRINFSKNLEAQSLDLSLDKLERKIKIFLSQAGFYEAINYSFGSPKELNQFKTTDLITLQNPLGEEYSAMRQSLFPGLLKNVRHNLKQQIKNPCLFETGVVFWGKNPEGAKPDPASLSVQNMAADAYAQENLLLAAVAHQGDFFVLKGILENLFASLKVSADFKPLSLHLPFLHPAQSANIWLGEDLLGFLGFLHPNLGEDAKNCVFALHLELLRKKCFQSIQVKPLPKFPGIQRDLALLVDESVLGAEILNVIRNFKPLAGILENAQIFDV